MPSPERLSLPLPRRWHPLTLRALAAAVGLERLALAQVRADLEHSPDPRARLTAELDAARQHAEILAEQCRLLRARLARVPPARRPHYDPRERMDLLALRARAGWSAARPGRELLLEPKTLAS